MTAAGSTTRAVAVVRDDDLDLAVAVADENLGPVSLSVLERVRQPFLNEPVGPYELRECGPEYPGEPPRTRCIPRFL